MKALLLEMGKVIGMILYGALYVLLFITVAALILFLGYALLPLLPLLIAGYLAYRWLSH